jgi:nesprin-1
MTLQVLLVLEKIDRKSIENENLPDNDSAIQAAISEQEKLIEEQERNRSDILGLLQRGKDLIRDPNCPSFVRDEVAALELKWNDCCRKSMNRLNDLRDNAR